MVIRLRMVIPSSGFGPSGTITNPIVVYDDDDGEGTSANPMVID